MRRTPGWIVLAGIALEVAALAFVLQFVFEDDAAASRRIPRHPEMPKEPAHMAQPAPVADPEPLAESAQDPQPQGGAGQSPLQFLQEPQDADARFYRARDSAIELLAAFYADGRVRIADTQDRRFAGMLVNGHADLLEIANNGWSELFLRTTPEGRIQFELRGGPYDAHVLTCEAFRA